VCVPTHRRGVGPAADKCVREYSFSSMGHHIRLCYSVQLVTQPVMTMRRSIVVVAVVFLDILHHPHVL